jgi:hypothetical protein
MEWRISSSAGASAAASSFAEALPHLLHHLVDAETRSVGNSLIDSMHGATIIWHAMTA